MVDMAVFKEKLLSRQDELVRRIHKIEDLLDDPKSHSFSEQAVESEFDEVYEAQGAADEGELTAIKAALDRIDNEAYGICVECGGTISEERLNAVLYAVKCRKCM